MTTRSVLTGEVGPRLAPFTLDPAAALASLDDARRPRGRLGAARPRGRLDRAGSRRPCARSARRRPRGRCRRRGADQPGYCLVRPSGDHASDGHRLCFDMRPDASPAARRCVDRAPRQRRLDPTHRGRGRRIPELPGDDPGRLAPGGGRARRHVGRGCRAHRHRAPDREPDSRLTPAPVHRVAPRLLRQIGQILQCGTPRPVNSRRFGRNRRDPAHQNALEGPAAGARWMVLADFTQRRRPDEIADSLAPMSARQHFGPEGLRNRGQRADPCLPDINRPSGAPSSVVRAESVACQTSSGRRIDCGSEDGGRAATAAERRP